MCDNPFVTLNLEYGMGSNLYDKFWCRKDFEGLILFSVITSICEDANLDSWMHTLVSSNLPMRFWCRGGFEGVIVFMVLTSFYGIGAICDSGVSTMGGLAIWMVNAYEGWYALNLWGLHQLKTLSLKFGGVVRIWATRVDVWLDSPTLKFVQADDGSWNMFCDDHA
jgi:hypothetical protein